MCLQQAGQCLCSKWEGSSMKGTYTVITLRCSPARYQAANSGGLFTIVGWRMWCVHHVTHMWTNFQLQPRVDCLPIASQLPWRTVSTVLHHGHCQSLVDVKHLLSSKRCGWRIDAGWRERDEKVVSWELSAGTLDVQLHVICYTKYCGQ